MINSLCRKTVLLTQIVICVILLLAGSGCSANHKDEVVVILKTKSYHTDECPRVNMANAQVLTIAEAKALDCKPCPGCKPGTR